MNGILLQPCGLHFFRPSRAPVKRVRFKWMVGNPEVEIGPSPSSEYPVTREESAIGSGQTTERGPAAYFVERPHPTSVVMNQGSIV